MSTGDVRYHHTHRAENDWERLRRIGNERLKDERVKEALTKPHKTDATYDVAYIFGISADLGTFYADRNFPLHAVLGRYDTTDEGWFHECFEATCILFFKDHYSVAHRLATVLEHDMVVARGIPWQDYKEFFDLWAKRDEHKEITRSPPDLFLRPYEDSGDWALLQRIRETQ